jgi:hypothetical protein
VSGDLVEVEPASRAQYPGDLGNSRPPVLDEVDDREVEHGVVAVVAGPDGSLQVAGVVDVRGVTLSG